MRYARLARTTTTTVALIGSAWVTAARLEAQRMELGVSAGRITDDTGAQHNGLTLSPSLAWADAASAVRLSGHASALPGGIFGGASLAIANRAAGVGPLHLVVGGEGAVAGSDAGYRAVRGAVSPRLRLVSGAWGLEAGPRWAGGGERRLAGSDAGTGPDGWNWLLGQRVGSSTRWQGERGVAAGAWYAREGVTVQGGWRHTETRGVAWQEWTGGLAVEHASLSLGVMAGQRTGALRERWIGGSAGLEMGSGMALTAEVGAFPSDPLMGRAGGHYATAGIRLRVGAVAGSSRGGLPRPVPLSDGRVSLVLRAAPGSRVELLADWTGWEPQAVQEVAPGQFQVRVQLPAGTHRFVFRVDGEWKVPEGVETEPDAFGGRNGVIRVRAA